jgi:DNA-binding response OmpR family regulator
MSVDDHPVNQMVVENMVSSMDGFKVTACLDGQSALDTLASRDYLPDLILLDVMMPGMSGYEVCKALRLKYKTSALPIIMVSAKNREKEIVRGLKSGANDYVTKPFSRNELVARIETQLRLKKVWRVELEAKRSNALLQEILPVHIIRRLKKGERLIADKHQEVTILFSDIVSFTSLAAKLDTIDVSI